MRSFLTMQANRAVDSYAIDTCNIPGITLMGNAGYAVIEQMKMQGFLENCPTVLILAGKGNNGGDGYVIAGGLKALNVPVTLITTLPEEQVHGHALHHFKKALDTGIVIEEWQNTSEQLDKIGNADIIVDALLGTGINGVIRSPFTEMIHACNQSQAQVIAVDVPSGVTGDIGEILEPCILADITVSLGFGKLGCLFEPARSHCGKIIPVEIGFPAESLSKISEPIAGELEAGDFPPCRFTRLSQAHKYTTGKIYVIAGSKGFTGAALLAATAALRSGAGLVKLAMPESLGQIGETVSLETMVDYLPETNEQSFSLKGAKQLKAGCEWADVVAIGPGIGRNPETLALVRELIETIDRPLVIDADALFSMIGNCEILLKRTAPSLITPHAGEFKNLLNPDSSPGPSWQTAAAFARKYQVSVLLKGAPSILANPSGEILVNSTGYAGMATAGSGDVLTGIIAALWAQWPESVGILSFAMNIHGKAAELKYSEKGVLGLVAGDIIDALPQALKEYGGLPT